MTIELYDDRERTCGAATGCVIGDNRDFHPAPSPDPDVRSSALVPAPEHVAAVLGLQTGAPVIKRRRTSYDGGGAAVSTSVSWFDGALAITCPALLLTERITQGTSGYVAEQTGRIPTTGHDQLAAAAVPAEAAEELGLAPGSAALRTQNRWLDQAGHIIEFGESVSPPDRWAFYDYRMTDGDSR